MIVTPTKVSIGKRAWYIPNESHATRGWVEGRPTKEMLDAIVARARANRAAWKPSEQAWNQLIALQQFVGRRVRVQFWSQSMWLLDEDEWPDKIEAHCEGVVTLMVDGFLQAFLVLREPINARTRNRSDSISLADHLAINCKLAPLAELCEVENAPEAA